MRAGMFRKTQNIPARLMSKRVAAAIEAEMRPVMQEHVRFRQRLVSNWNSEHRPRFDFRIHKGVRYRFDVIIANGFKRIAPGARATIYDLWMWWETTGTKPHMIKPRRPGGVLRFMVNGFAVFSKLVRHPGTVPKKRTPPFIALMEKKEKRAIKRGLSKGLGDG